MREETVEIFKEVIQSITPDLVVLSVIDNGGTFTLETKCT
ncbi:unnamed protein product, partial [marine sediment metagenome]